MRQSWLIIFLLLLVTDRTCLAQAGKVDMIIRGGLIVTMDAERRLIEDGFIAVKGGNIVGIGKADDLASQYQADEVIDGTGKVIIPGLINTHTHIPMTLLRGIADDLELHRWLTEHIFPAEKNHVNEAFVRAGTRLGLAEMIRGGTTTFCDMYYFEDAVAEETAKAGVRGVLGQTIINFPAPDHATPAAAFSYTELFISKWKNHPLIIPAFAPHSPYIVDGEHLRHARELSDKLQVPLVIHVSETKEEVAQIRQQYGLSPVQYLAGIKALNNKTIVAHAVHVSDTDMVLLAQLGCGIAHNPQSNMKLASGVAPVPEMLKKGLSVGLGTDGAASNNDLSLWEEMDMVAKLHKVVTGNPEVIPAIQAFEMATVMGARALHMENMIGSLENGKRADIVIADLNGLHQQPLYNIYSGLVYTTKASDVNTVIINGKTVMRERKLLTIDEAAVTWETEVYRQNITLGTK